MIFSENRFPLFRIMLQPRLVSRGTGGGFYAIAMSARASKVAGMLPPRNVALLKRSVRRPLTAP